MFGTCKRGITLIELVVVLFLIGLMFSVAVPNLLQRIGGYQRRAFFSDFKALVRLSWQQALERQKTTRIWYDIKNKIVRVDIQKDAQGDTIDFEPLEISYLSNQITIPESLILKNFYIVGDDMLRRRDIKTDAVFFFVAPDGMVQEVIINIEDSQQLDDADQPRRFSLVINPYTAHVRTYENFKTP